MYAQESKVGFPWLPVSQSLNLAEILDAEERRLLWCLLQAGERNSDHIVRRLLGGELAQALASESSRRVELGGNVSVTQEGMSPTGVAMVLISNHIRLPGLVLTKGLFLLQEPSTSDSIFCSPLEPWPHRHTLAF